MLTPESIEAVSSDDFKTIAEIASQLHEAVPGVLDMLSSGDVQQEETLRSSISLKIDEAKSLIDKKIADLAALKKDLGIRKGYQASDRRRIEAHRFSLLIKEKELRQK